MTPSPVIPSLEEIKAIASHGTYRRVPVKREIYADCVTPIEAMQAFRKASNHCFLLESAEADERWGRYSFLGMKPTVEFTCTEGKVRIRRDVETDHETTEEFQVEHPNDAIRKLLAAHKSPHLENFPSFTGGLVGYFSFDYIAYSEPSLHYKHNDDEEFLDVDLMLFDTVIAFDSYRQKIILMTGVYLDDLEASYAHAQTELKHLEAILLEGSRRQFEPLHFEHNPKPRFSQTEYAEMIKAAKQYIYEGDIFQVVLSNPLTASATGSLFDTYRVLRSENPSPYMFYFSSNEVEIAGASPETLTRLENKKLYTFPLAGTRPRGATPEEDQTAEMNLLADEKELAEHNMLVDLGRNDLGRVCKIGSVKVENYLDVLRFSHVMHIGSTVVGTIRDDKDALDAIDAVLPAGTLSGAPKIRACEIIRELEGVPRGIYGGALGYLDLSGNMDVCIAIRLAYKKQDTVCVQSGAGIVADSVEESEYLECQNKAGAVIDSLKTAEGGLS